MRVSMFVVGAVALAVPAVADPVRLAPAEEVSGRHGFEVGLTDSVFLVPLAEHGFALVHRDRQDGGATWHVLLVDTGFQERVRHHVPAPPGFEVGAVAVEGGVLYLAFTRDKKPPRLALVPLSGAAPTVLPLRVNGRAGVVRAMEVVDEDVYLRVTDKGRGFLLATTTAGGEARIITPSAILGRKASFTRLSRSSAGAQVDVAAMSRQRRRTAAVAGFTGGEPHSLRVQSGEGEVGNVLDAQRIRLDGGDELLIGTYATSERGEGARGLYFARFNGAVRVGMTTHSFADFEGFFGYLPERQPDRVPTLVKADSANGVGLTPDQRVLMHGVIELSDRFLVVGEAYYADYRTYTTIGSTTIRGVTARHPESSRVLAGFRRTHAFVAAFDLDGTLMWESNLPMGNVLTYDRRRWVRVHIDGDEVQLCYVRGTSVVSQRFVAGQGVRVVESLSERLAWQPGSSTSAWWYDNHFLAWGDENVKTGSKPSQKRMFSVTTFDVGGRGD